MKRRLALLFLLGLLGAPATSTLAEPLALPAEIAHLPATNPYRAALASLQSLPREHRGALEHWAATLPPASTTDALSPELRALADRLAAALVETSAALAADPAHWPLPTDSGNGGIAASILLPELGPMRQLTRIALAASADHPPADALRVHLAVARLGRHARHGRSLIHQILGTALIDNARAETARRLGEFTTAALGELAAGWRALPAPPALDDIIVFERDHCLVPFLRHDLLPLAEAWALADTYERTPLLRRLRTPRPAAETLERAKKFEQGIARFFADLPTDLFSFTLTDPTPAQQAATQNWLARLRAHAGGPAGFFDDLARQHGPLAHAQAQIADLPAAPENAPASDDPLLDIFTRSFSKVARTLRAADTADLMLQAAIHHRLSTLGSPPSQPPPADPWSSEPGAPFRIEPELDAAFVLHSAYESRPGAPLAFRFAGPRAGFVR